MWIMLVCQEGRQDLPPLVKYIEPTKPQHICFISLINREQKSWEHSSYIGGSKFKPSYATTEQHKLNWERREGNWACVLGPATPVHYPLWGGTLLFLVTVSLLPWAMYILKGDPKGHSQNVGVDRQGHFKGERADFAKSLKKQGVTIKDQCYKV